jgi:hypothetical protein
MRQPQISYQGYLEPVTRLINCHFGQLIHTCNVCMYCHGYEQLACSYSKFPTTVGNSWELEDLAVHFNFRWLIRPICFTMKLIFSDSS